MHSFLKIEKAPKDGTMVVIAHERWSCYPLAKWMDVPGTFPNAEGEEVKLSGWVFDDQLILGEEPGFLGWQNDIDEGNMPTHFCYPILRQNLVEVLQELLEKNPKEDILKKLQETNADFEGKEETLMEYLERTALPGETKIWRLNEQD